jgi:hypothetical protein
MCNREVDFMISVGNFLLRRRLVIISRFISGILQERQSKTTNNISQYSQQPGRNLNHLRTSLERQCYFKLLGRLYIGDTHNIAVFLE